MIVAAIRSGGTLGHKQSPIESRAQLVATLLSGSWRSTPSAPDVSPQELERVCSFLLESGGAALAWHRVRGSALSDCSPARQLHQAYLLHAIQAALHERDLERVCSTFCSAGIEPLLVKGWTVARLYPEQGLRPYGDIDLCVRPSDFNLAVQLLNQLETGKKTVDLHKGVTRLDREGMDDLCARSQLVQLGEHNVRIPSWEDHLRILCIHLLGHGVWRPLWLCDIALILENRPANFDWKVCLGHSRRRANWVVCAIGLANKLLGARIGHPFIESRAESLPRWIIPTVLRQWEMNLRTHLSHQDPVLTAVRVRGIIKALRYRWPNPIEATVSVGGPFNELPRFPFQLASCLVRGARVLTKLPKV